MSEKEKIVVGTEIISSVDEKRDEKLGNKDGKRIISARVYYPATFDGELLAKVKRAAGEMYYRPEILNNGKMPLVVYNHGYGSYMEANNKLCCELAKNGYFVVSVGHAYESSPLELSDGSVIKIDKSIMKRQISPRISGTAAAIRLKRITGTKEERYQTFYSFQKKYCGFMNERLTEWADDVRCIVSLLKKGYSEHIDFESGIGITGHSFGGNLAYYMCMNYEEYVCGVNIDGAIFGEYSDQIMKRPFLQICNRGNESVVSKTLFGTVAPVKYEVFNDITHLGFTDLKFFIKSKMVMGKMKAEDISERLIGLHVSFFNEYICQTMV